MGIALSNDFQYALSTGQKFSGAVQNAVFIVSEDLAQKGETIPPLQIKSHTTFIYDLMTYNRACGFWLIECATDKAIERLERTMPGVQRIGYSLSGYFDPSKEMIDTFWGIHSELDSQEPWNYEQPWAMACVFEALPPPRNTWLVSHILEHWSQTCGIFVQAGWFAYLGLKKSEFEQRKLAEEFPEIRS
jgi:hypothetical protein